MSNNNNHPLGEAPLFHVILSTGFGSGFCPVAPGTAGAFVALAIWWAGYELLSPDVLFWTTLIVTIVTTLVGVWTSNVMERYWGHDSRNVVIDEFIGVWIPCLIAPCGDRTWILALLAFILFRAFDITKPLGCRWVDNNMNGGWGVMLDDALAGIYALIVLAGVRWLM